MPTTDNNDTGIVWGAPPARRGTGNHGWESIVSELRARPGEWAIVAESKTVNAGSSIARGIRTSSLAAFRSGVYESQVRTSDGTTKVYARFVDGGTR